MNVAITYLIKDDKILLLFKSTRGYYVGPGGKQDGNETIYETARREFKEETGLDIKPKLASISTIISEENSKKKELTLLSFYADTFEGELLNRTPEGIISWQDIANLDSLPMFIGDKMLLQGLVSQLKNDTVPVRYASFEYEDNYKKLISFKIDGDDVNA